jgi:hypothetical protein
MALLPFTKHRSQEGIQGSGNQEKDGIRVLQAMLQYNHDFCGISQDEGDEPLFFPISKT